MAFLRIEQVLRIIWRKAGSVNLTVALCILLTCDLAAGYLSLKNNAHLFAPMNETGLAPWAATYGLHNLGRTAWFFILLGLLAMLGVNTFACTTDRVTALIRRRKGLPALRLMVRLAPHLMHYALILILSGYLASYMFSRVLDTRTLVPGVPMALPHSQTRVELTGFDPRLYQGSGLPAFKNRVMEPRARLAVFSGGKARERILSVNRPVWVEGHGIFLKDFAPQMAAGSMARRPRVDVSIHRDPGVGLYMAGIALFTLGLAVYLFEWAVLKPKGRE